MGMIKELYDFVSEKGLELHTHVNKGRHRIVIIWPNGAVHNGTTTNMEICETESEDPKKASEAAFSMAVKRYSEIEREREKGEIGYGERHS